MFLSWPVYATNGWVREILLFNNNIHYYSPVDMSAVSVVMGSKVNIVKNIVI